MLACRVFLSVMAQLVAHCSMHCAVLALAVLWSHWCHQQLLCVPAPCTLGAFVLAARPTRRVVGALQISPLRMPSVAPTPCSFDRSDCRCGSLAYRSVLTVWFDH